MSRQHPAGRLPDPREAKLPKWVQQELSHLRRREEELTALTRQIPREEGTVWSLDGDATWKPISAETWLRLSVVDPDGNDRFRGFDVCLTSGRLEISVGDGRIAASPETPNSLDIFWVPR